MSRNKMCCLTIALCNISEDNYLWKKCYLLTLLILTYNIHAVFIIISAITLTQMFPPI